MLFYEYKVYICDGLPVPQDGASGGLFRARAVRASELMCSPRRSGRAMGCGRRP